MPASPAPAPRAAGTGPAPAPRGAGPAQSPRCPSGPGPARRSGARPAALEPRREGAAAGRVRLGAARPASRSARSFSQEPLRIQFLTYVSCQDLLSRKYSQCPDLHQTPEHPLSVL
ncbi:translation initiation factor IF-2-like [Serinus canaria]|uniref:translation initiation factor IF-2-like n=1 Tax=Serinus canaria TaxID=9135 RepID=UPI0021CCDC68|nr:translation initiation factor IF-2-like [Serinus canaria]